MADAGSVTLIEDGGAAAVEDEFFRCAEFLEAEGTTHTLLLEHGASTAALPLIVRDVPDSGGMRDASSPYSYPGARTSGPPLDAGALPLAEGGLVSIFVRDRLGEPRALAGGSDRSVVLVSDPALPRKSRMSDRQQIRKNEAAGYAVERVRGPETSSGQRAGFLRVYTETMRHVEAGERYMFGAEYFDRLLASELTWLLSVTAPGGDDVAAAALAVRSDGFLHYYLSGTADAHRRGAPSKNLIVATTDLAEELDLPMNLGGGVRPGDGLEEFKRGFANRELTFRTHELICDPGAYARLAGDRADTGFFPLYRAPAG
jgi:hypothetical protein